MSKLKAKLKMPLVQMLHRYWEIQEQMVLLLLL